MKKVRSGLPGRAYRLTGRFSEEYRVTEGLMSCRKVLDLAKAYDSTLTVFLCALLMISIHREMMLYKEKKPVVITVPVNLRQYFFFGNYPELLWKYPGGLSVSGRRRKPGGYHRFTEKLF